ncbi:3'-5' exonuclease [Streptomyces sp. NPDC021622]|uniref:3'-5' exonuclease n=1 Tax=Streptomyces sp. NPDC021622 TaxID=3155013 RepID=UPI0033CCA246
MARYPTWPEVRDSVREFLADAWLCAHNAHVDYRALTDHLRGWQPTGVIDTLRLSRTTYPEAPTHSLDALIEHTHLDLTAAPAQRHRATYDAFATALLFLTMADEYETWADLTAAPVPPGLPRQPWCGVRAHTVVTRPCHSLLQGSGPRRSLRRFGEMAQAAQLAPLTMSKTPHHSSSCDGPESGSPRRTSGTRQQALQRLTQ